MMDQCVRLLFFFIILWSYHTSFSQVSTSFFQDKGSNETIASIPNQNFTPFRNTINNGLSNGIYWVKIVNEGDEVIAQITNARILDISAFRELEIISQIPNVSFFSYKIPARSTIYLKINCQKEAFIPLQFYSEDGFRSHSQNQYFIFGAYYGFAFMVLILNIFFFITFKDITFLVYTSIIIIISSGLFHSDGLTKWFIDSPWLNKESELISHLSLSIFGTIFSSIYLQYEIHVPRLKFWLIFLSVSQLVCYLVYLLTESFYWFAGGEVILFAMVLPTFWLSSLYLFKKSVFAQFFFYAYGFIMFMAFDYYLAPLLGIPSIELGTNMLKVGGVIELLVLTYAVLFRMRILQKENEEMKNSLYEFVQKIDHLEVQLQNLKEGKKNLLTKTQLNPREIEIISLISQGHTNKEIADKLFISINTVKFHTKALYKKLDIGSRQEARIKAAQIQGELV